MTEFFNNPDLEAVVGSHLYGVATPTSDLDLRGFVVEPPNYLIGLHDFEQKEFEVGDRTVYGLKKFFKILRVGNTNCLEVLFANKFTHLTEFGQMVLDNRHLFISKAYYRAIRGFALAEWRKARAVSLAMEHQDKEEEDILTRLSGKYQLKRFELNDILDIIFLNREGDPRKEVSSTRFLGEKRKESVEKFGFSVKNAYHSIRLLDQGAELMRTGKITFPRPNCDELKKIRNGEVTIEELDVRFRELDKQLEIAAGKSNLPHSADMEAINDLYVRMVAKAIAE